MSKLGIGVLGLLVAIAVTAPLLPIADPNAQPDSLTLGSLPPLTRAWEITTSDGEIHYARSVRQTTDRLEITRGHARRPETRRLAAASSTVDSKIFWLGTDELGRDLLSRLIHGARISLAVGLLAAGLALVLGTAIGLIAGLAGKRIDALLMRTTDIFLSIPRLFLAILLVGLFGSSTTVTIGVLGATTWMAAARLVRAEVLAARGSAFVDAARTAGTGPFRLAFLHLLPVVATPLLIESTLRVGDTILLESALSFLGLGVQPPAPSWGNVIADGRGALRDAWWIATLPGLCIVATVLALHVVAERWRLGGYTARRGELQTLHRG